MYIILLIYNLALINWRPGFFIFYLAKLVSKADAKRTVRYFTLADHGKIRSPQYGLQINVLCKRVGSGKANGTFFIEDGFFESKTISDVRWHGALDFVARRTEYTKKFAHQRSIKTVGNI